MRDTQVIAESVSGGTEMVLAPRRATVSRDALGDRLKELERREGDRRAMAGLPVVVRVDGRSFSRFTKGLKRPFDPDLAGLMTEVARYLVQKTNAKVAYTQSDEISLVLEASPRPSAGETMRALCEVSELLRGGDAEGAASRLDSLKDLIGRSSMSGKGEPELLFSGRFQKLCSVIAGLATARFLQDALRLWPDRCGRSLPVFDARAFEVPNREEAVEALVWRELDATKNAVSMAARAFFPHSRLQGRSSSEMQEMLFREHGVNFNDYPARFKRGVYLQRRTVVRDLDPEQMALIPEARRPTGPVQRSAVVALELPPIRRVANRIEVLLDGAEPLAAA